MHRFAKVGNVFYDANDTENALLRVLAVVRAPAAESAAFVAGPPSRLHFALRACAHLHAQLFITQALN